MASTREIGLPEGRTYCDFVGKVECEAERDDGIEAVSVVVPNHMRLPVAHAFLQRGIHVICDKPLAGMCEDAMALSAEVQSSDAPFVLTHNYSGYPMVREARERIAAGDLGDIRLVQVEYAQDWLAGAPPADNKQAAWRTDPSRSGIGGAAADIGTHRWHLASFVTGLRAQALSADIQSFVPGKQLGDNAHVLLRYHDGARGMLWCGQVAAGCENDLRIRVFGAGPVAV